MQRLVIAAVGAASLLSLPALAQSSTSTSSAPTPGASSAGSPTVGASGSASEDSTRAGNTSASVAGASSEGVAQLRQKITQDLQQDGFTDIHVAPASFLVHAENRQGDPIVMIINPDSVFSMTEVGNGGAVASDNGASAATPAPNSASKGVSTAAKTPGSDAATTSATGGNGTTSSASEGASSSAKMSGSNAATASADGANAANRWSPKTSGSGSATASAAGANGGSGTSSSASEGASASAKMSASTAESSDANMPLRQKIRAELQQDGFKNIRVSPTSFMVRAKNKEGERVAMIINPDSVFSMTEVSGSGGSKSATGSDKSTSVQ